LNIDRLKSHIKVPLYRNSIFLMTSTLVTTGLGFFFWMVVARYYTEYEVGISAAIIATVNLLALISVLGFDAALIRFLPKAKDPTGMINTCFTVSGFVALVVSGIYLAGVNVWSPETSFIRENAMFVLAFVVYAFCWPISSILDAIFVAKRRAEFTLIKNTVFSILKLPLPIIFFFFFHAFGIVSSWGLAIAIALVIALLLFLPRVEQHYRPVPRIDLSIIKGFWRYSTGNYFVSFFAAAPALFLPIIIVHRLDAIQNAHFYIAWMMAGLLSAIPHAVSSSLFAEGSHFEEQLTKNARRSFKFILLLLVPSIIFMVAVGKWLLLLFGENYSYHALTLLWILCASSLFMGINNVYYSILRVRGRIRELIVIRALIAVSVLVSTYFIAPEVGIVGIGYAWVGAHGLISIYVLLKVRWRYRVIKARQSGA